jgi:hypothetical protein
MAVETDRKALARTGRDIKMEDAVGLTKSAEGKPTYRSWKKKYRKMRVNFDQKMQEGESLYKLEEKALKTARRLAIENE